MNIADNPHQMDHYKADLRRAIDNKLAAQYIIGMPKKLQAAAKTWVKAQEEIAYIYTPVPDES